MAVYINFILFSVYLSYIATQALLRSGHAIDSQKSIMILLVMVGGLAWIGKWLSGLAEKIEDDNLKEGVSLSTFIWTGHAVGLIFVPSEKLSALAFIPFMAILAAVYRPLFFKARGYTPFLAGMSALTQVASLAYILRIGGDFSAAFGVAFILWLIGASITRNFLAREDDGGWGAVLCYGQAIPVFWFLLNISNQTISYSQRASFAFMGLAVLGFVVTAWRGRRASAAELPAGWIIWAPAMLFGLSLLVNFNIVQAALEPLEADVEMRINHEPHFWYHIVPGLDPLYQIAKPFMDYIPGEGVIFGVYIPRLLFEGLDSSLGGYLTFLHLAGRLSFLLFILVTVLSFAEGLKISHGPGFALALFLAVTNTIPLQLYAAGKLFAWLTLERLQLLFIGFLAFRIFFHYACKAREDGSYGSHAFLWGFITGVIHAFSALYEMTFAAPAVMGLIAGLSSRVFPVRAVLAVIVGGFSFILGYLWLFQIPAINFFYYHPLALVSFGKQVLSHWGKNAAYVLPCCEYKEQINIFDAAARSRALLTLHHTGLLALLALFLAALAKGARGKRLFPLAAYLAVTTFGLYISRGQKYTEIFMGPYTNLVHVNMALILAPALLAYTLGLFDENGQARPGGGRMPGRGVIAWIVTLSVINGAHISQGLPGWTPYAQKEFNANYVSRGMDEALSHMYAHLSRQAVLAGPRPAGDYTQQYRRIRDEIYDITKIQLYPVRPPYDRKTYSMAGSCEGCVKGPALSWPGGQPAHGKKALFRWSGEGYEEYSVIVRSAEDFHKVYFRGFVAKPEIEASLPADYSQVIVDLRAWRPDGLLARSTISLASLPEETEIKPGPALIGEENTSAPRLTGPDKFVAEGSSATLTWTRVKSAGYDVAVGGPIDSGTAAWRYFSGSATGESITVTGLPADCSLVYIHLEAKAPPEESRGADVRPGGKWYRNSYAIYSVPTGYERDKSVCK